MDFKVLGRIRNIETIAVGNAVREIKRLRPVYGLGRRRKRKGVTMVQSSDGTIRLAELHCYEAHGMGRHELRIKDYVD